MSLLILKLIFASYFTFNIFFSLKVVRKKIEVNQVPMSVYERAVTWHQDIMNMTDADQKLQEFQRWKKFVENIPRRSTNLNLM